MGLTLNKQIQLEDVNMFVQKFLELPLSYDKSYFSCFIVPNYSYDKDFERVNIFIDTQLTLDLSINNGIYSLVVNSNHGLDYYKLDSVMGYQFYNWLFSQ